MDDNTRDVLVTALQVGLGGAATLLGGVLAFVFGRLNERERWKREDAIRLDAATQEARQRWVTDRRQLYARFMNLVTQLLDQSREFRAGRPVPDDVWQPVWHELYQVFAEIIMVAPGVHDEARNLYQRTIQIHRDARTHPERSPLESGQESHQELHGPLEGFLTAAQRDLT